MTALPLPIPDATPAGQIPRGCRWIEGDPVRDADWSYCQARVAASGLFWCREHLGKAFRLPNEERGHVPMKPLNFGSAA